MKAVWIVGVGIVGAIVVIALPRWRARRKSAPPMRRSLVDEYRIAENSWYVLGYIVLIIVIGVSLLVY
jgi:uncharacterized membrane protein YidH (DUF202 family)